MGLHQDGSTFNLSPLETELRRRVWAKLRFLDLRAAEEMGCPPSIGESSYDCLLPSDLDDSQLASRPEGEMVGKSRLHQELGN
jgi:hypothetical protein